MINVYVLDIKWVITVLHPVLNTPNPLPTQMDIKHVFVIQDIKITDKDNVFVQDTSSLENVLPNVLSTPSPVPIQMELKSVLANPTTPLILKLDNVIVQDI